MSRPFPIDNPFPVQASSRLPDDPVSGSGALITIDREPISRVREAVLDYVRRYPGTSKNRGQIVAIRGEHGSGKTHTILTVIPKVREERGTVGETPVQITVKAETPDLTALYRDIFAQLPFNLIEQILNRSIAALAAERFALEPAVTEATASKYRQDRNAAARLLSDYLVDRGAVELQQVQEIGRVTEGRADFQRALPCIVGEEPELAKQAYLWLSGQSIEKRYQEMLGVTSLVNGAEMYKSALKVVAGLFERAGRPLLVYIDQYEKLITTSTEGQKPTPTQITENVGFLRRLVDVLPPQRALLLLAGTDEAWNTLPTDLQDRFGQNVVTLPALTREEAISFVFEYVDAISPGEPDDTTTVPPDTPKEETPKDISPFTADALDALLRFSRGNIRRFLQSCSAIFTAAVKARRQEIGVELVELAIDSGDLKPPADEQFVAAAIETLLKEARVRWLRGYHIFSRRVDYAIVDEKDKPLVVIELTRAIYRDDETRRAADLAALAQEVRRVGGKRSLVVAIVIGYASRAVAHILQSTVRLVVYDAQTFGAEMSAILSGVAAKPAAVEDSLVRSQLEEVRAELGRLEAQRETEAERLEARLLELVSRSGPEREVVSGETMVDRWSRERNGIDSRITSARATRRENDFRQLCRASAKVRQEHRDRWLRPAIIAIACVVAYAIFVIVAQRFELNPALPYASIAGAVWLGLTAVVVSLVVIGIAYFRLLEPADLRAITLAIDSLDELEQLHFKPDRAAIFFDHPDPQVRFVATRSLPVRSVHLGSLKDRLMEERLPLLRRAIARAIARHPAEDRLDVFDPDIPESLYVVESWAEEIVRKRDPRLRRFSNVELLLEVAHAEKTKDFGPVFPVLLDEEQEVLDGLVDAFEDGTGVGNAAASVSRQRLRSAMRSLSPFEDGLGTLDDLRSLATIDQLYLFFAQLLFYAERAPSAPKPRSSRKPPVPESSDATARELKGENRVSRATPRREV
jgi:hypothetical protein